jgi:hypothetical protein
VLRRLDHAAAADVALDALGCWAAVDDELDAFAVLVGFDEPGAFADLGGFGPVRQGADQLEEGFADEREREVAEGGVPDLG